MRNGRRWHAGRVEYPTREQESMLDVLAEDHGTLEVWTTRHNEPVGLLMHVIGDNGWRESYDENGRAV